MTAAVPNTGLNKHNDNCPTFCYSHIIMPSNCPHVFRAGGWKMYFKSLFNIIIIYCMIIFVEDFFSVFQGFLENHLKLINENNSVGGNRFIGVTM